MTKSINEEKDKEHKLQNYLIVLFIFALCIGLVLYLCQIYLVEKEEEKKIPIIRDSLSEIFYEDLNHYILDNPNTTIYMCTANDDTCRTFEKKFKKLLQKKNYQEDIVYLNLTDLNKEEFLKEFNEKYPYKKSIKNYFPAFIAFEDGKIKNILQGSKNKELDSSKVKVFFELNGIGE